MLRTSSTMRLPPSRTTGIQSDAIALPTGAVFGDADEPLDVRLVGREVPPAAGDGEQVVMNRRAGPAVQAAFLGVQRPDPLRRTQPLHPVLRGGDPVLAQLVGDQAIPELRRPVMDLQRGVDQVWASDQSRSVTGFLRQG